MTTTLHAAVSAIAGRRGAMVISASILRALALRSVRSAIAFGVQAKVEFETTVANVSGRYAGMSVDPSKFTASLTDQNGVLGVDVGPSFVFELELLAPRGGPSFSTIQLTVPATRFELSASGNTIRLQPAGVLAKGHLVLAASRAAAIAASGADPADLKSLEDGLATGGGGSTLINKAFGELQTIDLAELFPAFTFGGKLDLKLVNGSLLVIPESFTFIGNTGCPKGDATDGFQVVPQNGTDAGLTRTWPVLASAPTPQPVQPPVADDGLIAAYLPQPVLDVQFGKVTPAIEYHDEDNGFIGYDVTLRAQIRGVTVSIDPAAMALRLKLDFHSDGEVNATIDVPCVGRQKLATAKFEMPAKGKTASVEAIVRLGVDTAGRLNMLTELGAVNLGEASVTVDIFGKYMSLAGGQAAVFGFIIDAVLGRIIAHNLPGLVFDAIKNAVNQHFFVLADLKAILSLLDRKPGVATWSDDSGSTLMGLTIKRG